jgi:hypothetical protein
VRRPTPRQEAAAALRAVKDAVHRGECGRARYYLEAVWATLPDRTLQRVERLLTSCVVRR